MWLCIGVDVGGTNTDAVILRRSEVLSSAKVPTTADVTSGITGAIRSALGELPEEFQPNPAQFVARVNIGTTHFVNAIVQRKGLTKVAVLRLCGPATRAIPPLCDFPVDLRRAIGSMHFFLNGGYQYDCSCITDVDEDEVKRVAKEVHAAGIRNIVIVGVFSPASNKQEEQVAEIIRSAYPAMSMTLSHEVGLIGFLERENASVLNESLKPLCKQTVMAFCSALRTLGLKCPFYLTQNDGTITSAERTLHLPVFTFASGPTNSMRGAAFLSGIQDAIVIDIGGTTTDVGVLKEGFPRQASTRVKIGGVNTNFRMPDVLSVGLGGGSHVEETQDGVTVGPLSVGFELHSKALVFGGETRTSTDIAVASGFCDIGDKERVKHIKEEVRIGALVEIKRKIEAAMDRVKLSGDDQPVILVGGGSILVNLDKSETLKGASKVICPPYYQAANAVGAALGKVSGTYDRVIPMKNTTREKAREEAEQVARERAVKEGADEQTLKVIDVMDVPLAYLPGNAVRYYLKVVGDLGDCKAKSPEELSEIGSTLGDTDSAKGSSPVEQAPVMSEQANVEDDDMEVGELCLDPATGDWILNKFDIECIAIGAGIMGCGGGGSPYIGRLRALELLKNGKEIRVIHPNKLGSTPELTGIVAAPAFMGAPAILIERLFSGRESISALKAASGVLLSDKALKERDAGDGTREVECAQDLLSVKNESHSNKKLVAVVCAEIGGANSTEPLVVGAELGLPIVDADGMGRAFPELQMFLPFVLGSPPYPAAVGDEKGNVVAVSFVKTSKHLENFLRLKVVEMGCMAGLAFISDWKDVKEKFILNSLSRTWRLGNAVLQARHGKKSPVDSILQHENGKLLITGKIADVSRGTEGGFNRGKLSVEGSGKFSELTLGIEFQNENYVAYFIKSDGTRDILATVPDLISLVDEDTGEPIATEEVRYGLRVAVIAMPCYPRWALPEGLAAGGPVAFGYHDVTYSSIASYEDHLPIPQIK